MVYTTCVVFGCRSTSYRNKDLRFFRIPSSKERRRLWIQVCKRPDLKDKDDKTLNYKHVCSLHFEKSMYSKKNLKKSALPTLHIATPMYSMHTQTTFDEDEPHSSDDAEPAGHRAAPESVHIKVEYSPEQEMVQDTPQNLQSEGVQTCRIKVERESDDEHAEETSRTAFPHRDQSRSSMPVQTSERHSRILPEMEIMQFGNKNSNSTENISPSQFKEACDKFLSPQMSAIVKAQVEVRQHPDNPRYTHDFKLFCLNLYQSSPDVYKALANIFHLPPENALSNLMQS